MGNHEIPTGFHDFQSFRTILEVFVNFWKLLEFMEFHANLPKYLNLHSFYGNAMYVAVFAWESVKTGVHPCQIKEFPCKPVEISEIP